LKIGFITTAQVDRGTMLHDLPSDLMDQILHALASTGQPGALMRMGMVNRALHLQLCADRSIWRTYWTAWVWGMQPRGVKTELPPLPNNLPAVEDMYSLDVDYEVMLIRKVALVQMRHDEKLRRRRKRIQDDRLE